MVFLRRVHACSAQDQCILCCTYSTREYGTKYSTYYSEGNHSLLVLHQTTSTYYVYIIFLACVCVILYSSSSPFLAKRPFAQRKRGIRSRLNAVIIHVRNFYQIVPTVSYAGTCALAVMPRLAGTGVRRTWLQHHCTASK
jgi:hypothetical protein